MKWKELGFKILDTLLTGELTIRKLQKQTLQCIDELFPDKYQGIRKDDLGFLAKELARDYYFSHRQVTAKYYLEILQDIEKTNIFSEVQ